MAAGKALYAKEDRRTRRVGENVDIPFLILMHFGMPLPILEAPSVRLSLP